MLTDDIRQSISEYTASMTKPVSIILNNGSHEKREELVEFLKSVAAITDSIDFIEREFSKDARSPLTFTLEVEGEQTGIYFSGIPGGHEFNTFILAVLQSGGVDIKLEDSLKKIIGSIPERLSFETFISLSCHNCPEVVQALNQFALLNKNITSEMIDGGLFQDKVTELDIQGVPSVFLNGELFANGRVEISSIIEKLSDFRSSVAVHEKNDSVIQDVLIVGGGPAGISAAIYASRKGLKVTLVTKNIGGQLKETLGIENFISASKTTGIELTNAIQSHLSDYDVTIKEHVSVVDIETGDLKSITLSSGEVIHARSLIIATGANWKKLGIPGEVENIGNGVAYCPHCDGPFYKGKDVAVIGGGNSGAEAALDLSGIVDKVTLIEFLPELKADQILINQLEKRKNITVVKNSETTRILAKDGKVIGLEYKDRSTEEIIQHEVAGIFVQIGLVPNSEFLSETLTLNKFGEIVVDEFCNTSVDGIFACGDVTTIPYKQIIMSMGEGSKAAITASDYLQRNPVEDELVA